MQEWFLGYYVWVNNALISSFIIFILIILCDLFEILITRNINAFLCFANIFNFKIHWLVNLSSIKNTSGF